MCFYILVNNVTILRRVSSVVKYESIPDIACVSVRPKPVRRIAVVTPVTENMIIILYLLISLIHEQDTQDGLSNILISPGFIASYKHFF